MEPVHLIKDIAAKIPDNWEAQNSDSLISLFDPVNGFGAMQFSFYIVQNTESLNLVDELQDYLKDEYEDANANLIEDFAYFNAISPSGIFWRYWLLIKRNNIIFVSYNCAIEDIDRENAIVDSIIKSIFFISNAR